ncbi:unnamed protein product [Microthlaspi erraticum]|uniref:Uncharacterized protein n=1 Tax=Microthlaspi erraticum TaxID=1685480 RepID=A0A6D2LEJ8_9BRAS|nr:unnamed protein product [Microthlaspi erraticum]CAA7058548.1 unnamed protein product [Microthlaspi erraticum]
MTKKVVLLLLMALMVSCSNDCAFASPQPSDRYSSPETPIFFSGWRSKMIRVTPSFSIGTKKGEVKRRDGDFTNNGGDGQPPPPPPPPLLPPS